jgi:hypothetical protein
MVKAGHAVQVARKSAKRLYRPSWIDRFTDWVERLPGPSWAYYLGLAGLLFLAGSILFWAEGTLAVGKLYPMHVFLSVTMGYLPAVLHYLDRRAGAALDKMRPLLKANEDEYDELHFRLTALPAWPALLAGLIVLALAFVVDEVQRAAGQPDGFAALGISTVSWWFTRVLYRVLWWLFGTFLYHTWHQLRQINRVYTKHTRVNLFRLGPLYAFSTVTALTAVGLLIPPYGFVALLTPDARNDLIAIAYMLPITGLALAAFVWPLLGIHRLLSEEKTRLLDENSQHLEAAITRLRERAESGELEDLGALNTALGTLESERALVSGIPTWPWQTETVRLLFTALGLPLGLWLAQYILQRVLGP